MGDLFFNDMSQTPGGDPWYFYFLFLIVKLPLPILLAFIVGLVEIFRRRVPHPNSRGYLFLRVMLIFWLFPMAFIGAKFLRYTLSLMPLVYLTAAIGMIAVWHALRSTLKRASFKRQTSRVIAATVTAAIFIIAPA